MLFKTWFQNYCVETSPDFDIWEIYRWPSRIASRIPFEKVIVIDTCRDSGINRNGWSNRAGDRIQWWPHHKDLTAGTANGSRAFNLHTRQARILRSCPLALKVDTTKTFIEDFSVRINKLLQRFSCWLLDLDQWPIDHVFLVHPVLDIQYWYTNAFTHKCTGCFRPPVRYVEASKQN